MQRSKPWISEEEDYRSDELCKEADEWEQYNELLRGLRAAKSRGIRIVKKRTPNRNKKYSNKYNKLPF